MAANAAKTMAINKPRAFPRPSSRYLDRLLLRLRSHKRLPTRIWPKDGHNDDENHLHHQHHQQSSFPSSPGDLPPPLKLSHPLLLAIEASGGPNSPHFPQLLGQLIISGLARHPLAAGRVIKLLCSSFSSLPLAVSLFSGVDGPDAFLSNTILRSYLSFSRPDEALAFFRSHALPSLVSPNHFTFPLLAKLFSELGLPWLGRNIHALLARLGFESDLFVRNSLIHMYFSFGDVDAAGKIFCLDSVADLVTWNSMIDGCVQNGMVDEARKLFDEMRERDLFSWNIMIAGHAGDGDMMAAKELFVNMPERDVVSWNSLIDGYARKGEVGIAREHFDEVPVKNVISWNIMLALYARSKDYNECLRLFDSMIAAGDATPNEATFVSVLTACANLGDLERGKCIHSLIKGSCRILEHDLLLQTTLLTMYAKNGAMDLAWEVFDLMEERNVVSWNSMIIGYGLHGHGDKALEMFMEMEKGGPRPNEATFICILSACTHGGMVLEGWWCFDRMIRIYGIEPKADHYGCMVDLLGRSGLTNDLEELLNRMPVEPPLALWGALMSSCMTHSNLELGEIVGRKLIEVEPQDIGSHILLSNIYAAKGRWDEVEKVRQMMKENGLEKAAGTSLVSTSGTVSSCHSEECISSNRKSMLFSMLREIGTQMKLTCRQLDDRQKKL